MRILIIGQEAGSGVGGSLLRAARARGIDARIMESARAYDAHSVVRRVSWHLLGRRPYRLRAFSDAVVTAALEQRADVLLATGIAPLDARALGTLRSNGIITANFLTDDPWNRSRASSWFNEAVIQYGQIFTPRRANIADLQAAGCARVAYLPFGYDHEIFYREPSAAKAGRTLDSDVYFAGGADADRVPYLMALIRAGLDVRLHGGNWSRFPETRPFDRGIAEPAEVRQGLNRTKVGLCLVRRANRDGNCMRTFEVPATGACLLAEDTPEHREIFGPEDQAALYFSSIGEMVEKARVLAADAARRGRIAAAGHDLMLSGRHTYHDRLAQMLAVLESR